MRFWNWLTSGPRPLTSPTPDVADARARESAPASAETESRVARATWPEPEVVVRQRSVDGLNHWQMEQVREIVREEIAALLPQLGRAEPAPGPASGAGRAGMAGKRIRRRVWEEPTLQPPGGLA